MGCICKDEAKINTRNRQNIANNETNYLYKQNPQININNQIEIKK